MSQKVVITSKMRYLAFFIARKWFYQGNQSDCSDTETDEAQKVGGKLIIFMKNKWKISWST